MICSITLGRSDSPPDQKPFQIALICCAVRPSASALPLRSTLAMWYRASNVSHMLVRLEVTPFGGMGVASLGRKGHPKMHPICHS